MIWLIFIYNFVRIYSFM